MNKNNVIQKLMLVFILINVIEVILLENTSEPIKNYIGMLWATIDFILICSYVFWGVYNIYIVYDYYGMRSYVSDLNIKTCRDYIQHKNIYDTLKYTWEEVEENRFIVTFPYQIVKGNKFVAQVVAGVNYQINLYKSEAGTEITCMFIKNKLFQKAVLPWYIDRFIEQKFNAKRREISYSIDQEEKNDNMV